MTKEQTTSFIFTALKFLGGALAARGITVSPDIASLLAGPDAVTFYAGVVMAAVPVVRDWFTHSNAGKLLAATTVPGIEPIRVSPTAAPEIQALAVDRTVPMIAVAALAPSPYATGQPRR